MVRSIITSLKNQGVTISLDDFGTGYSSLAQLRTLPFDRLKIDRSFVSELRDERTTATSWSRAIVSLGDGLDLPITAEGIENAAILDELRDDGQAQGPGLSLRPARKRRRGARAAGSRGPAGIDDRHQRRDLGPPTRQPVADAKRPRKSG